MAHVTRGEIVGFDTSNGTADEFFEAGGPCLSFVSTFLGSDRQSTFDMSIVERQQWPYALQYGRMRVRAGLLVAREHWLAMAAFSRPEETHYLGD